MKKLEIPDELKLETYPKRSQKATFDRINLVIDFQAGSSGIGATVKSFIDAIPNHDEIVKCIEEKMKEIEHFKKVYRQKTRFFRNLDSAWNVMLDSAYSFDEYLQLLPKVKNAESRLARITDVEAKAELQAKYDRFKELEPVCSKQMVIYQEYKRARDDRDDALATLVKAEKQLGALKENEVFLASQITSDHIIADEMKKSISNLFANVHGKCINCHALLDAMHPLPHTYFHYICVHSLYSCNSGVV